MALLKYLLLILLLFSVLWALSKLIKIDLIRKYINGAYIILFFLLFLEVALNIVFRIDKGNYIFQLNKHPNSALFEKHPYMSVTNRKGIEEDLYGVHFSHNKYAQRSKNYDTSEIRTITRIVTIGGSTTYGVGVNDWQTWPNNLDSLTGDDTIIINLSVPGHSTVEHLITASLYLQDFDPDVIIIHAGLNDMRVSHVEGLMNDYSNFHEPHLTGSMGLCYLEQVPKISTLFYLVQVMQNVGMYPICSFHSASISGTIAQGIDPKAIRIYKENLKKLLYLCKYHTDKVLFIPQILIEENIENDELNWWIPYIPSNQLLLVLDEYNATSKRVVDSANCVYLQEVDEFSWQADDFSDASHLNDKGNKKLAGIINKTLSFKNQLNTPE